MITNAYSIFDTKALMYYTPWFQPTHGAAARVLSDLANDVETNIGRHPSDYTLYMIGTYNDQTGELTPVTPRVHIMDAISLVQRPADLFPAPTANVGNLATTLNGKEAL